MLASIFLRGGQQAGNGDGPSRERIFSPDGTSLRWVMRPSAMMGGVTVLVFVPEPLAVRPWFRKASSRRKTRGCCFGTLQASQSISWHEMQHQFQMVNKAVQEIRTSPFVGGFVGGANALNNALLFVTLKPLVRRRATG
ncbi:hypothetical protein [Paraburkholderia sp. BL6669N2]|uniref:hypothetical protein n=1 Tax=Paraburkholderia sp. BL6669N2 TaxID=1938807 RepID=UPI001C6F1F6A|nr:hypothetical protein [Paraburkholderia sp. BL6669N2]